MTISNVAECTGVVLVVMSLWDTGSYTSLVVPVVSVVVKQTTVDELTRKLLVNLRESSFHSQRLFRTLSVVPPFVLGNTWSFVNFDGSIFFPQYQQKSFFCILAILNSSKP